METGEAIIVAIYNRLTTDATLQAALGGTVRLYRVMAPKDPEMPYLVHRYETHGLLHDTSTYLLDLWDYNETSVRIDDAVDRIKALLHEWRFVTAADEVNGVINWFSGGYIPTDTAGVWHYATQWDIRIGAARDITNTTG